MVRWTGPNVRRDVSVLQRAINDLLAFVPAALGIEALYRKPNTSQRNTAHPIYPYLLRNLKIDRSNHVWATDTTYIPMRRGFIYLVAVLDWCVFRRKLTVDSEIV